MKTRIRSMASWLRRTWGWQGLRRELLMLLLALLFVVVTVGTAYGFFCLLFYGPDLWHRDTTAATSTTVAVDRPEDAAVLSIDDASGSER